MCVLCIWLEPVLGHVASDPAPSSLPLIWVKVCQLLVIRTLLPADPISSNALVASSLCCQIRLVVIVAVLEARRMPRHAVALNTMTLFYLGYSRYTFTSSDQPASRSLGLV